MICGKRASAPASQPHGERPGLRGSEASASRPASAMKQRSTPATQATQTRPDMLRISDGPRIVYAYARHHASGQAARQQTRRGGRCRLAACRPNAARSEMGAIRYCNARRAALCRAVTQDFFSFQKFFIDFMQITGMMVMWLRARARVLWKKQKIASFEDCHPRTRFHMKFS